MWMELSNKSLALLLVAAIVVSLGGTVVSLNRLSTLSLTGFAVNDTDVGYTNFSITSNVSVVFDVSRIDFGSGSVNGSGPGLQNCTLESNGTTPDALMCLLFPTTDTQLILFNDGNQNVSVRLLSNATADEFIGGDSGLNNFSWKVAQNESNSCLTLSDSSFNEVAAGTLYSEGRDVCDQLDYNDNSDSLAIDLRLVIPENAFQGAREATITAFGVATG
jgi:hypothetical protein